MALIVVVTGMSGSGKTTALHALEDVGFVCMDNLPVVLLPKVLELVGARGDTTRLSVVVDVREREFIHQAGGVIDELVADGVDMRIAFLDARDDTIIQRFRETRRRHPLDDAGNLRAAIAAERVILDDLRTRADEVIDTSDLNVHELKRALQDRFGSAEARALELRLMSFGFKHGHAPEADVVFDVRFLPNPYFRDDLRDRNGRDRDVAAYVLEHEDTRVFLEKVADLLDFLVPRYEAEGRPYVTVGVGCTGGQHRSVAIVEWLAARMLEAGVPTVVRHREAERWKTESS